MKIYYKKEINGGDKMDKKQEIRSYVTKLMSSSRVKGFYSSIVPKHTTANIEEVEQELEKMINEGVFVKEYELICDSCMRNLDRSFEKDSFDDVECDFCGEEGNYINVRYVRKPVNN